MAARITSLDYRAIRRDTKLADLAIDVFIGIANRRINALVGLGPSEAVLKDAELFLTAYFALAADPRKKSEGIPPANVSYELMDYLQLLRNVLGDYFPLLGNIDGPVLKTPSINVITANEF